VVQKKSGELEKAVGGTANLHQYASSCACTCTCTWNVSLARREYEGRESQLFLSYFPNGIQYLEGGIDTGYSLSGSRVHCEYL
jgi:hypothetical protein